MKKFTVKVLAVFACLVAISMSGCNATGTRQDVNSSDATQSEAEAEGFRYGNQYLDKLYEFATDKPEVLASTVSAYPSILEKCGIETDDPIEIFHILCYDEHGGEYQIALLDELDAMLRSPNLSSESHPWTCQATYLTRRKLDENAKWSPANMELVWNSGSFEDRWVMTMTYRTGDGGAETGYFDVDNGFARCYEIRTNENANP